MGAALNGWSWRFRRRFFDALRKEGWIVGGASRPANTLTKECKAYNAKVVIEESKFRSIKVFVKRADWDLICELRALRGEHGWPESLAKYASLNVNLSMEM
jgi:hypothetical protein